MTMLICRLLGSAPTFAELRQNAQEIALNYARQHPSNVAEPNNVDKSIVRRLKTALESVDIRVLGHPIIGGDTVTSVPLRGLL